MDHARASVARLSGALLIVLALLTAVAIANGNVQSAGWAVTVAGFAQLVIGASGWVASIDRVRIASGIVFVATGIVVVTHAVTRPLETALVVAGFLIAQGLLCVVVGCPAHALTCFLLAFVTLGWASIRVGVELVLGVLTRREWPAPALRVIGLFVAVDMLWWGWSSVSSRRVVRAVSTVALLIGSVVLTTDARAQSALERPPTLQARDLAPPTMLKGPRFTVDAQVPIVDLQPRFVVRSDFGVFEAHGRDRLGIRVIEVGALEQLERTSKSEEFLKAAGNAAVRPVESAANMLANPVETVKGAPAAVGRFFDRVQAGAKSVANAPPANGTTGDKGAAITKRIGGVSANVLGYEEERRALAKRLGVDPYTTNHVLSEKMNDMAWVAFSGRLGLNTVVAVAVPFSTALSATTIVNNMIWDMKPADVLARNEKKLGEMGIAPDRVQAMLQNQWYTISTLTALVDGLERLRGVKGRDEVVAFAAAVRTEDRANLVVAAVAMLARYHATVQPLAQVSAPGPIIARTKTGTLLVPAPLDYVPWTEPVATFARRPDLKSKQRTVWLTGTLSSRARQQFAAAGWTVREGASSTP